MKQINKVAVLGAGVMGATIAAHLTNAGIPVLLLDIVPREPSEAETKQGLTLSDKAVRNRFALAGLEGLKKMKPAPFFLQQYAELIEVGNFEDDMVRLKECDWVIEVVVENMAINEAAVHRAGGAQPQTGRDPGYQHQRPVGQRDGPGPAR